MVKKTCFLIYYKSNELKIFVLVIFFEFAGSASTDNQSIQARYRQSNVIFDLDSSSHGLEEPGLQSALQGYDSLSSAIKRLHKQLVENVSSHG